MTTINESRLGAAIVREMTKDARNEDRIISSIVVARKLLQSAEAMYSDGMPLAICMVRDAMGVLTDIEMQRQDVFDAVTRILDDDRARWSKAAEARRAEEERG